MTPSLIQSDPDVSRGLEPFWERLGATASWCTPLASADDPRGSLRSLTTQPRVLEYSYLDAVHNVVTLRRRPKALVMKDPLEGGRLMVYFPGADLADGAAEQETKGFFDVNNAPPWDTWVGFFRDSSGSDTSYAQYLVAWIPQVFVSLAQSGIDVNPERCIEWLDDANVALRSLLGVARRGA